MCLHFGRFVLSKGDLNVEEADYLLHVIESQFKAPVGSVLETSHAN